MGYRVRSHHSWHRSWQGLVREFGGPSGFMLCLAVCVSIGVLGSRIDTHMEALGRRPESHLGSLQQLTERAHWPELAGQASAAQLALIQRLVDRLDQIESQNRVAARRPIPRLVDRLDRTGSRNRVAAPRPTTLRAASHRPKPDHRPWVLSLDLSSEIDHGPDEERPAGRASGLTLYMPGDADHNLQ